MQPVESWQTSPLHGYQRGQTHLISALYAVSHSCSFIQLLLLLFDTVRPTRLPSPTRPLSYIAPHDAGGCRLGCQIQEHDRAGQSAVEWNTWIVARDREIAPHLKIETQDRFDFRFNEVTLTRSKCKVLSPGGQIQIQIQTHTALKGD